MVAAYRSPLAGHSGRPTLRDHLLAKAARVGQRRSPPTDPGYFDHGTRRVGAARPRGTSGRCDVYSREKRGPGVGKPKVGKGMTRGSVGEGNGLAVGMGAAGANVREYDLLVPALEDIAVEVPAGTPVIADKGHDSDPLRDEVKAAGFEPVIPHRSNRSKPS